MSLPIQLIAVPLPFTSDVIKGSINHAFTDYDSFVSFGEAGGIRVWRIILYGPFIEEIYNTYYNFIGYAPTTVVIMEKCKFFGCIPSSLQIL